MVKRTLQDDDDRCCGKGWEECDTCLRRTTPPSETSKMLEPPLIVAFECEFCISE